VTVNGLFVVHSDLESLKAKGVFQNITERNEEMFIELAITLHPFAQRNHVEAIASNNVVHELKQPGSSKWRVFSWFRLGLHLIHAIWYGKKLVQAQNADFIRSQDPFLCGLIGYSISRLTGKPFCISVHADYEKMEQMDPGGAAPRFLGSYKLTRVLERFLLRRADLVLSVTKYIAGYVEKRGARPERIRLFRHFINPQFFDLSTESSRRNSPVVSVISRLSRQKYILDLPLIAAALVDMGVSFQVEVAGEGEARNDLEKMISKLHLADRIDLLGFQDRQRILNLLGRSTVCLVLCGGASLLEAAARSCPIVAYDWEWHDEIVETGKTGILVPEGDILAAAKAARYLVENPKVAAEMGQRARERVLRMYQKDRLLEARRKVYHELVGIRSSNIRARYIL